MKKMVTDEYRAIKADDMKYEEALPKFLEAVKKMEKGQWRMIKTSLDACTKCGACVNECPIYLAGGSEIYNPVYRTNLLRKVFRDQTTIGGKISKALGLSDMTAEDLRALAENMYRCTMCRRCSVFCTLKIDNCLINREGRVLLDSVGIYPKELRQGVDQQLAVGAATGMERNGFLDIIKFMEDDIKERKGKTVKIPVDKKGADMLLLHNAGDYLAFMEDVTGMAEVLDAVGADWTLGSGFPDSVNYGLFYSNDAFVKIMEKHLEEGKRLGVKRIVIGECGHAYKALNLFAEPLFGKQPFKFENILCLTDEWIRQGKIKLNPEANPDPVTYHDACNAGRMSGIFEEPRRILKACCKDYREMQPNREQNYCCGGGSGFAIMSNDKFFDWRMKVSGKKKVEQIKDTGAKVVVSVCSNCKAQIRDLIRYYNLDVRFTGVHDLVANALVEEVKEVQLELRPIRRL